MMNKRWIIYGVILNAMGAAIYWSSHTPWGLRGLLYMALGTYLIYDGLKEKR